jgi:hypothetical protein
MSKGHSVKSLKSEKKSNNVSVLNDHVTLFNKITDVNRNQLLKELKEEAERIKRETE